MLGHAAPPTIGRVTRLIISLWHRARGDIDSLSFTRLVQTHGLSAAGDAFVAVALAGSVFFSEDPNTARERVALSLVLTMAPFAVVAPFLGPVIDRARGGRRVILLTAASARALLCLLMAGVLEEILLYPLAFMALVFSKTHAVAKSASVPEIVKSETMLVRANSVLALTAVLAGFVGGALAVAVATLAGSEWSLRAGALVFSAAAALAFEVGTENTHPSRRTARETGEELRSSGVFAAGIAMASVRLCVGFLAFLIAFDLRRAEAPTWWFAVAVSASMVGSSIGNVIAPRLRGHVREEHMLSGMGLMICISALALASSASRITGPLLAAIVAVAAATAKLSFDSLVQRDAPSAVQGRSFARFEAGFQLSWVVGALLPVGIAIDTGVGYVVLGTIAGMVAVWYAVTHRRSGVRPGAGPALSESG